MDREFPYKRSIESRNTRCELAEGVAFSESLKDLTDEQRSKVNDLIHEYLEWIFGEPKED